MGGGASELTVDFGGRKVAGPGVVGVDPKQAPRAGRQVLRAGEGEPAQWADVTNVTRATA